MDCNCEGQTQRLTAAWNQEVESLQERNQG